MRSYAAKNMDKLKRQYSSLFKYLYRYVTYRIPHKEDAEDVLSDIFVTALDKIDDYDSDQGNMRQWMTGIARNKVLSYWGRRKTVIPLEDLLEIPDRTLFSATFGRISRKLEAELILQRAAPETKALLALRYVDGLTYEEIAQTLGKEPAAVRQQFSRLHKRLRLKFKDE